MIRRPSRSTSWWRSRAAVAAGLVVFLSLAGTGASYALWSSQAKVTASVTSARVSVVAENLAPFQFGNELLKTTSAFAVRNTGTRSGNYVVTFGTVETVQTASLLTVTVWKTNTQASCIGDPPAGTTTVSGSWAGLSGTVSGSLEASATDYFCVKTTTADRSNLASSSGTMTVTPKISATLTVGSWTAVGEVTASLSTRHIYPNAAVTASDWFKISPVSSPTQCMSTDNGNGKTVTQSACVAGSGLQLWNFTGNGTGYYQVAPSTNSPQDRTLTLALGSSGVATMEKGTVADNARWQLQKRSDDSYQLVVKDTGMCLQWPLTGSGSLVPATCNGATTQQFKLTANIASLTCTPTYAELGGWIPYVFSVTLDGSPLVAGPYEVKFVSGTNPAAKTTTVNSNTVTLLRSELGSWADGIYKVQFRDSMGSLRYESTVTVGTVWLLTDLKVLSCGG